MNRKEKLASWLPIVFDVLPANWESYFLYDQNKDIVTFNTDPYLFDDLQQEWKVNIKYRNVKVHNILVLLLTLLHLDI